MSLLPSQLKTEWDKEEGTLLCYYYDYLKQVKDTLSMQKKTSNRISTMNIYVLMHITLK